MVLQRRNCQRVCANVPRTSESSSLWSSWITLGQNDEMKYPCRGRRCLTARTTAFSIPLTLISMLRKAVWEYRSSTSSRQGGQWSSEARSEEHTSELQSLAYLV